MTFHIYTECLDFRNICSQVFYRIKALKISKNPQETEAFFLMCSLCVLQNSNSQKISQNLQEDTCNGVLLQYYCCKLTKKGLHDKRFPMNITKSLRTIFFIKHLRMTALKKNTHVQIPRILSQKFCAIFKATIISIPFNRWLSALLSKTQNIRRFTIRKYETVTILVFLLVLRIRNYIKSFVITLPVTNNHSLLQQLFQFLHYTS